MDFIIGLPKSGNKLVIMVVVDHLSKYAHLCTLQHPFTASTVAQIYLLGQRFQIKTEHQTLKYFLEQHISSPEKQKWVTKLFGYDYEIIYKKGKDNVVADALSQKYEEEGSLFSPS
jgi:hypothetical protein